jgi:hypothetical protein
LVGYEVRQMSQFIAFVAGVGLCVLVALGVRHFWRGGSNLLSTALKRFFGSDLTTLPIVSRSFATLDLPNLQLAIDQFVETHRSPARVVGYSSLSGHFQNDLRSLIGNDTFFQHTAVSAPQYREVDIDVNRQMRCVENGIHLIETPDGRIAAHVRSDMMQGGLHLEVMAANADLATRFVEQVRDQIALSNVFRGKVISLDCAQNLPGRHGFSHVRFHRFPVVKREQIILPEETLALLERNTLRFFQHAEVLRRSGRSLKRGLLLHGKPGTGKTFTAKWLAQSLEGITTILVSGDQLGMIKECCQLARMLAPALVILEDVDLIATERDERRHPLYQITLHQLLNEMDGMGSNTEVLFLLTTNRPEAIETAISARPGRVDQAIEFPLPDAECRRRLLALYGEGLHLELQEGEQIVARTGGASPAFIQELVRKAALVAAERGGALNGTLHVVDADMETALREMIYGGGELTRNLLGFANTEGDAGAAAAR